ncbi:MAG: peptidase C1 [Bacteroidetes bacterium]|nr:peptidase C1 [Bacteroidota bacterium]
MSKYSLLSAAILLSFFTANAQKHDKAVMKEPMQNSYYRTTILKGLEDAEKKANPKEPHRNLKVDFTNMDLPTNPDEYTKVWHNTPVSQGQTGTCWCFSTTSFYESEVARITGQKVKLSEMYIVYWEYVERAKYYVQHRGDMALGEGSETNALVRLYKIYGAVPQESYKGINPDVPFHDHSKMYKELDNYLKKVKELDSWNEEEVIATTKSILNHYLQEPPKTVSVNGKNYTPQEYLTKVLKLNMDEYVNFMSLMSEPFYTNAEYKVSDNWWHSKDYFNVPVEDFISGIKKAIKGGYSISIGGDVSEPGLDGAAQVGVIPTFDIPSEYIDDNSRLFRFYNQTTTDDHAMHLVGYQEKNGKTWFLVKDSGAGSRNCGETCKSFGYFFINEDYIKLKMMTVTVNKNAVQEILKKVKS